MGDASATLYDWDVDHRMYFGTRILSGELLYTREFDDKLPFVQFMFLMPALLGSVRAWIVSSALILVLSAIGISYATILMIRQGWPTLSRSISNSIGILASASYLFLISVLPSSMAHPNSTSASVCSLAYSCLIVSQCLSARLYKVAWFFLAALFAATSISIRPYYAPTLVLAGLWLPLRGQYLVRHSFRSNNIFCYDQVKIWLGDTLRFLTSWIATIVSLGLAINIAPYLFANKLSYFMSGLEFNAQGLNPQSISSIISAQINFFRYSGNMTFMLLITSFLVPAIILLKKLYHLLTLGINRAELNLPELDLVFAGLFPAILLEAAILSKHWWPNYQLLFAPFASVSLALSISFFLEKRFVTVTTRFKPMVIILFCSLSLLISSISEMRMVISSVRDAKVSSHPESRFLKDFKLYLQTEKLRGMKTDFLDAHHMYTHWKLRESRHGFPHAANLKKIEMGWGEQLKAIKNSDFPLNKAELCKSYLERGPSIIVARVGSYSNQCLSSAIKRYSLSQVFRAKHMVNIFIRNPE